MKLVSIPTWLDLTYGDDPGRPQLDTVRAWCRDGKLYPPAMKQGRAYYLDPRACYVDPTDAASMREARRRVDESKAA